ncbi:MAG: DUF4838 domain-containing protein [Pirellulales bacterium]|nr:DUF4838 domain-containing protein [Pirellulales bacterium]
MRRFRCTLLCFPMLYLATAPVLAEVTLFQNGKSLYQIVIAAKPSAAERHAAEELQHYFEQATGAKLPIVADDQPRREEEIVIGGAPLPEGAVKLPVPEPGLDGFTLQTAGKRLLISGTGPRAALYGVYALLEDKLGVRWYTPDFEQVPTLDQVKLGDLNESETPALEYREVYWSEFIQNADFAARHRLNGNSYQLTEKHGGRMAVYFPFVHSFDMLVPPALYDTHPEYFPLIGGERRNGYVQRCLTNPDVLRIATENVLQWIKEHPEASIISVSQNDTINNCQCPTCKAIDDAEGGPAGSLLTFVNAVAEAVEKEHPNVRIDTLAYQYTRKPPKSLRPRNNVIVRLCSIECCFAHPFDNCSANENGQFVQDIKAWQPVAPLLYVWDYTTNFGQYQQPFPNFGALQPNVQFFVKHGVRGVFEQGNYSAGGHGEMEPLRGYLLAKLLWNPNADVPTLTDQFLNAYYGKSADKMREYVALLNRQTQKAGVHAHIYDSPGVAYLHDEFLNEADKLLDEAETLAENDDIRFRVETARLGIWYVKLVTKRVADDERRALLDRYLQIAHKAGISNASEGQPLDAWANAMRE